MEVHTYQIQPTCLHVEVTVAHTFRHEYFFHRSSIFVHHHLGQCYLIVQIMQREQSRVQVAHERARVHAEDPVDVIISDIG